MKRVAIVAALVLIVLVNWYVALGPPQSLIQLPDTALKAMPAALRGPLDPERAVVQLRRLGVVFSYEGTKVTGITLGQPFLRSEELLLINSFPDLKKIDFNACPNVDDELLTAIVQLKQVEELNLGGSHVTDDGLKQLKKFPRLKRLYLWRTSITNEGMKWVVDCPSLEHINLWDTAIGDKGLAHLARCATLRRLCIGQSIQPGDERQPARQAAAVKLTPEAIADFRRQLPKCRVFYWRRDRQAVPEDVERMAKQVSVSRVARKPDKPRVVRLPADLGTRKSGVDWSRFLGPSSDGHSPESGLTIPESGELRLMWHRDVGEGYGTCTVSRGRLFYLERKADKLRLICLNSETGKEVWVHESPTDFEDQVGYGNGPRSSPVVDGDRVYVYGADGHLYCISIQTGKPLWHVDTAKQFGVVQYFFGVGSSPVVEGDLLITVVGGSPANQRQKGRYNLEQLTGNGTGIVAFNKYDGKVEYAITDTLAGYATPRIVNMDGRRRCLAFVRQGLLAFDPNTGKVDFLYPWRAKFRAGVNAATPIVNGNEVFITEAYGPGSAVLRVKDGKYEEVWRDPPKSRQRALPMHWSTPVLQGDFLYGCAGRHTSDAELRCVQWKSGQIMWRRRLQGLAGTIAVDGHLIVVDEYGRLDVIRTSPLGYIPRHNEDLAARQVAGRPLLSYPVWSAPVLSHGLLYLRGKGRLICLEAIPQK